MVMLSHKSSPGLSAVIPSKHMSKPQYLNRGGQKVLFKSRSNPHSSHQSLVSLVKSIYASGPRDRWGIRFQGMTLMKMLHSLTKHHMCVGLSGYQYKSKWFNPKVSPSVFLSAVIFYFCFVFFCCIFGEFTDIFIAHVRKLKKVKFSFIAWWLQSTDINLSAWRQVRKNSLFFHFPQAFEISNQNNTVWPDIYIITCIL